VMDRLRVNLRWRSLELELGFVMDHPIVSLCLETLRLSFRRDPLTGSYVRAAKILLQQLGCMDWLSRS
jgi:hypothetical protein